MIFAELVELLHFEEFIEFGQEIRGNYTVCYKNVNFKGILISMCNAYF